MGEEVSEENKVKFIKKPDDHLCDRISAGGRSDIGYYMVFRGKIENIKMILEILLKKLTENDFEIIEEKD